MKQSIHALLLSVQVVAVALGLSAGAGAGAKSPSQPAPAEVLMPDAMRTIGNDALTIATWNLQFLPIVGSRCCNHIANRLTKVAENILSSEIDVIALNEVFTDAAKHKLSDLLGDAYPYQVTYVDGDGDKVGLLNAEEARAIMRRGLIADGYAGLTAKQDSGLMLFSKHPFQRFPVSDVELAAADRLQASADGESWRHVAFSQFGVCEGFILPSSGKATDCMANKGVALVRVVKPGVGSENIYNIAFTHFEAGTDDPDLGPLIRDLAIDTPPTAYVKSLFERTIGDRTNEHNIVLGDLNINGAASTDRPEWRAKFTQRGRLFTDVFTDTWHAMRPANVDAKDFDPGFSNQVFDTTQNRVDYILHGSDAIAWWDKQAPCVQHVRIPPSLYLSDAHEELSDHRPVVATFNRPAKHCSPQTARVVTIDRYSTRPLTITGKDAKILYPKGAQWYLLADPGTYSIAGWTTKGAVNVEVYSSANMSVPLNAYRGGTRNLYFNTPGQQSAPVLQTAEVFVSPNKPLLVKVTLPGGSTGAYSLGVKKHAGYGREDAIVLFPGVPQSTHLSSSATAPIERWFRLDTDGPVSGRAQTLEFSVTASEPTNIASRLVNPDGSNVLHSKEKTFQRRQADDNFKTYHLVTSAQRVTQHAELNVAWKTNLQMMVIQHRTGNTSVLTATNETGWGLFGSDDNVRMNLFADGIQLFKQPTLCEQSKRSDCRPTKQDDRPNFGSFDSDTVAQVDAAIKCSVGFLDSLKVEIAEDEWLRDEQQLSGDISGSLLLGPDEVYRGAQRVMLVSDAGAYRLKFYLMRGTHDAAERAYRPAAVETDAAACSANR